jgi:GWxTD domain-containing protein
MNTAAGGRLRTAWLPSFRRLALGGGLLLAGACGGGGGSSSIPVVPTGGQALTQQFDVTPMYLKLGRLAAGPPVPFVAALSWLGGPGDTVIGVFALSMEDRALLFTKDLQGFIAHYRVTISLTGGPSGPVEFHRDETVRINTGTEARRDEESIFFQQILYLLPGDYHIDVIVQDRSAGTQSQTSGDYTAPSFPPGSTSAPIFAYEVKTRTRREDPPTMVANPRGLIAHGADTLLAYVEGYGLEADSRIPFDLRDSQDSVMLSDSLHFQGGRDVEGRVLRLAPSGAPLGELRFSIGSGAARRTTALFASVSRHFVVTDWDQLVSLLRYFADKPTLDSLRRATPDQRRRLWIDFWKATDPDTLTPQNEALDEYFTRLSVADQRYKNEGVPGWQTDRGEVYIKLGDPDEVTEGPVSDARVIRWTYLAWKLTIFFQDRNGIGRYELTPTSRGEYERLLKQLKAKPAKPSH